MKMYRDEKQPGLQKMILFVGDLVGFFLSLYIYTHTHIYIYI